MRNVPQEFDENAPLEIAASEWLSRLDRGLTADEQDKYTEWLANSEANRKALARYLNNWDDFDRLAGIHLKRHARVDPDLLTPEKLPPRKGKNLLQKTILFSALPFAAALAFAIHFTWFTAEETSGLKLQPALELLARIERRTLEDGSIIEINRGSILHSQYSDRERRVYITKGEANFIVAKNPERPFIVNVAGVDVQAVGTVFSVKLSGDELAVIVTEGKVNIKPTGRRSAAGEGPTETFVEIGQRASVDLRAESMVTNVSAIDDEGISEALRWKPRLLDYDQVRLGEIVREFNRCNPIQIQVSDPSLEAINLSSSFWSDNVEGFVRLMESSFGMKAEWRGSREIVLSASH